jgi:hypothetical protein
MDENKSGAAGMEESMPALLVSYGDQLALEALFGPDASMLPFGI